jgi:hypothetical protein
MSNICAFNTIFLQAIFIFGKASALLMRSTVIVFLNLTSLLVRKLPISPQF